MPKKYTGKNTPIPLYVAMMDNYNKKLVENEMQFSFAKTTSKVASKQL